MRDGESREASIVGHGDCVHVHPSDPGTALVALYAGIMVQSSDGTREIKAAEFFQAPDENNRRTNYLRDEEPITRIRLPIRQDSHSVFLKAMDRSFWSFALVNVGARSEFQTGKISEARVVLGGVSPIPWVLEELGAAPVGQVLTAELVADLAAKVLQDATPLTKNRYKVRMVRALVKRALLRLGGLQSLMASNAEQEERGETAEDTSWQ